MIDSAHSLEVHDLSVQYGDKTVLWGIDFALNRGQLVGLIGPNGAGKSTLIQAIMGVVPHRSGWVKVFNRDIEANLHQIGYVPQKEDIDWDFPLNVLDLVLMGRYHHLKPWQRLGKHHREKALHCLEELGMADHARTHISELSGGQQQRVFLARALAQENELYLMDEPFVGVDAATQETTIELLRKLRGQGKTIVVVHHDLSTVESYFDTLLLLNMRLLAHGPTPEIFTPENLQTTYGGRLNILTQVTERMDPSQNEALQSAHKE